MRIRDSRIRAHNSADETGSRRTPILAPSNGLVGGPHGLLGPRNARVYVALGVTPGYSGVFLGILIDPDRPAEYFITSLTALRPALLICPSSTLLPTVLISLTRQPALSLGLRRLALYVRNTRKGVAVYGIPY